MSRSKWKILFNKISKKKKKLYIWSRNSTIPSSLIGNYVFVHFGNGFKKILVSREKVGFKFGAFAPTRKKSTKIKITVNYGTNI